MDWGSSLEEHSSPPHAPPLSPLSLMWLPEGLCRSEVDSTAARRSALGILDRIQTNLLPQSRLDPRSGRSHRSLFVYEYSGCCTCGARSLRRYCRTGVVASRSSRPWGRLRRLHHQRPVRGRNPRDRSTRGCVIVTTLLLDWSWAIWGCVGNNFLLFTLNPNKSAPTIGMLVFL
jgi:hypothetical protein